MTTTPSLGRQKEIAKNLKEIAHTPPDTEGRWSWRVAVGGTLGGAVLFVIARNYLGGKRMLGLDTRTDSDTEEATSERYLLYGDGALAAIARINHQPGALVDFGKALENGLATIGEGGRHDYNRLVAYFRSGVSQCVFGYSSVI